MRAFAFVHLPAVVGTIARSPKTAKPPQTLCGLVRIDHRFARSVREQFTCPSCERIVFARPQLYNVAMREQRERIARFRRSAWFQITGGHG